MKKIIAIIFIALALVLGFLWISKSSITAHLLSKELGVPVSIQTMGYSSDHADIRDLIVSNPKGSKTPTALKVSTIDIFSSLKDLFGERLTIDLIDMNDIMLGVEMYNQGTSNNWKKILSTDDGTKNPSKKKYLIKKLKLTNLTVVLTDASEKTKNYGPISVEFNDISEKSGFPLHDIEKAIMQKIIKEIIQEFKLQDIIKSVIPKDVIPKILPLKSTSSGQ